MDSVRVFLGKKKFFFNFLGVSSDFFERNDNDLFSDILIEIYEENKVKFIEYKIDIRDDKGFVFL